MLMTYIKTEYCIDVFFRKNLKFQFGGIGSHWITLHKDSKTQDFKIIRLKLKIEINISIQYYINTCDCLHAVELNFGILCFVSANYE